MDSISIDLSSVSNSSKSLTSMKKRLTTCFHSWRKKPKEPKLENISSNKFKKEISVLRKLKNICKLKKIAKNEKCKTRVDLLSAVSVVEPVQLPLQVLTANTINCSNSNTFAHAATAITATSHCIERIVKVAFTGTTVQTQTCTASSSQTYDSDSAIDVASIDECNSNMADLNRTFIRIRHNNPGIDVDIRSILMAYAQTGATIQQIKADYCKHIGRELPIYSNRITEFLLSIPYVTACCNENGILLFNIQPTEQTKHLHDFILKQRMNRKSVLSNCTNFNNCSQHLTQRRNLGYCNRDCSVYQPSLMTRRHCQTPNDICNDLDATTKNKQTYKENYEHIYNRYNLEKYNACPANEDYDKETLMPTKYSNQSYSKIKPKSKSSYEKQTKRSSHCNRNSSSNGISDFEAHLLDFQLMGDDFFMYMARMELNCKFVRNNKGVLKSGLCVSGQTIKSAYKRILHLPHNASPRQIIINLGSVDIMQGAALVEMEYDYKKLVNTLLHRGWKPILTTLAPLANMTYEPIIKEKLNKFNRFLLTQWSHMLTVVDIHRCMLNECNEIRFDCYQNAPRLVTGARQAYVFWNIIGRQRVLQLIKSKIEY